ncbi:transcriptional regulator, ArsR family [Arboricoccus pini]|uniref:Transcriptional regulator, ArsR family n=1 Tax=Arboricoccus pini TaxID=1963835 RepID=A0A212RP44_9PROT|nr:transcriptional regulator, ArsR family [Arboricoccus pini]
MPAVLAALSDPTRLALVMVLAEHGEQPWGDFDLRIGKSTFSHHVKVLREAGLLHHRREGTRCWISLRRDLKSGYGEVLAMLLKLAADDPLVAELAATARLPLPA